MAILWSQLTSERFMLFTVDIKLQTDLLSMHSDFEDKGRDYPRNNDQGRGGGTDRG